MMFRYACLNPVSKVGLDCFGSGYTSTSSLEEADALLVRSADMYQLAVPSNVKCVARAGAGVNNIPLMELAQQGIPVFNTPGANANGVKELVFAAMLLAARDVVGGINWAWVFAAIGAAAGALYVILFVIGYNTSRITYWLDPWADAQGSSQ